MTASVNRWREHKVRSGVGVLAATEYRELAGLFASHLTPLGQRSCCNPLRDADSLNLGTDSRDEEGINAKDIECGLDHT